MRLSRIRRETSETEINCTLEIDGSGIYEIDTGCGFLNHMLELFTRHGRFDIKMACRGDVHIDYHHTVEDTGIVLGRAFSEALGDRTGINRYGSFTLPMDETLILCAVDISGRPMFCSDIIFNTEKIGDFDTELVSEFLIAFSRELGATLHVRQLSGTNSHHIAEGVFKTLARALAIATDIDEAAPDSIPSTKGLID